jgi:hypothetical protein
LKRNWPRILSSKATLIEGNIIKLRENNNLQIERGTMPEQKKRKKENQLVMFEQTFFNSCNYRYVRRKIAIALSQVREWINRSLKQQEQMPMEFRNIGINSSQQTDYEKDRELWHTQFHI